MKPLMVIMGTSAGIRLFQEADIQEIVRVFEEHHWSKPASLFEGYWKEQQSGKRLMWLAHIGSQLAGYITLSYESRYKPFLDAKIPEIMDLNVLPPFRRQGIGSMLLDTAESEVKKYSKVVGIGVGLYPDYGSAQKLYIKRGYVPDGRGITYNYHTLAPGVSTVLDDDLVLWFTKTLYFKCED